MKREDSSNSGGLKGGGWPPLLSLLVMMVVFTSPQMIKSWGCLQQPHYPLFAHGVIHVPGNRKGYREPFGTLFFPGDWLGIKVNFLWLERWLAKMIGNNASYPAAKSPCTHGKTGGCLSIRISQ